MKKIFFTAAGFLLTAMALAQDTTFYQNAEWSPDGTKIVTEAITKAGTGLLFNSYIIDITGLKVERKIINAVFPKWSPDGRFIAYSRMTGIKYNSDIWITNIATGDSMQVTSVPSRNTGVSFSPDGKRICFSSDRDGGLNLYVSAIDGSGLQKITADTFKYYNAVWSPNADEIVYFRERGDGRDKVFLISLKDSKEVKVTDDSLHDVYPSWLPGGKTIIYTFSDPAVKDGDSKQLALVDKTGKNKRVIPGTVGAFFARVSADGKKLAFTRGNWPQDNIYIADINGTNVRCITCND